jgi:FHA domain
MGPPRGTHALGERDALQIGVYRLTLRKGFPPSVGTPPPFAMKPARLRVLWGPLVGTEDVIGRDDVVTMGASDACSLRLLHSNVSGEHAIVRTGRDGSHEIESRSGPIYVNGRPLSGGRRSHDGDTIDVSGVTLVRYAAATPTLDPHDESPRERASAEGSLEVKPHHPCRLAKPPRPRPLRPLPLGPPPRRTLATKRRVTSRPLRAGVSAGSRSCAAKCAEPRFPRR